MNSATLPFSFSRTHPNILMNILQVNASSAHTFKLEVIPKFRLTSMNLLIDLTDSIALRNIYGSNVEIFLANNAHIF